MHRLLQLSFQERLCAGASAKGVDRQRREASSCVAPTYSAARRRKELQSDSGQTKMLLAITRLVERVPHPSSPFFPKRQIAIAIAAMTAALVPPRSDTA